MYRWKSTIPSCRFSHCYCWWNFKISHRKQPRPLADTHVNFERPAQVSISGDCIAITWRHLIFFCFFFTAPAEGWINGAFHSDDNHAVFPIMTTVTARYSYEDCRLSNQNQNSSPIATSRLKTVCGITCSESVSQWPIASHCQKLATHGLLRNTDSWIYGIENIFPRLIESMWIVEHAIGYFKSFRLLSGILPFSMIPLLISSVMLDRHSSGTY